jgi:HSP20 family molecular chaperone IbpA
MLRVNIAENSDDYLIEAQKPGTYPEKIALQTLTCDLTKGKLKFV